MAQMNMKSLITMALLWAVYLTVTMVGFEQFGVSPASVPGGVIGWLVVVEIPRSILGLLIIIPLNKMLGGK